MTKNVYPFDEAEVDYRAGAMSVNGIAKKHGIPEPTLRREAKKRGWIKATAPIDSDFPEPKRTIDWDSIEREYRANMRSNRQIAKEYGVSDVAILKRAKRDGWTKDLAAAIRARADDKVSRAAVSSEVSSQRTANDTAIVEARANVIAQSILREQTDIAAAIDIVNRLFAELKAVSAPELQVALEEFANLKDKESDDPKRAAALERAYNAAIALPGRAATVQKLVVALATLIDKERLILNLDKESSKSPSLGEFLANLD